MDTKRSLIRARYALLRRYPFFGLLALYLDLQEVPKGTLEFDTIATDGHRLLYAREFVDSLTDGERVFIVGHEVGHLIFRHIERLNGRDQFKWNYATDEAINNILRREIEEEGGGNNTTCASRMEMPKSAVCDECYQGMSADAIYAKLPDMPEGGCSGDCRNCKSKKSKEAVQPGDWWCYRGFDDHSLEKDRDGGGEGGYDPKAWKERAAKAAQAARAMGRLPAGLERLVEELLNPSLPWTDIVRDWVVAKALQYYTFMPPNKRAMQRGLILPTIGGRGLGRVAIGIDVSGSITQEELRRFASEMQGILDAYEVELHIFVCDADVHKYYVVKSGEELPKSYPGGGGTDFRPVFKRIEEEDIEPTGLAFLTDAMGAYPEKAPSYPVLWVVNSDYPEKDIPFGGIVRIPPEPATT